MSYYALYRKLRPRTFADVVGQPHIVTTLINQIMSGRVSHAYLFCGTRGTGKTSTAKIFAKAINCADPVNGEPCGACASCESIQGGRSMNVIEIDAASNNSVDNIRDIREQVKYAPTEGEYRVYIIDEVHMLSTGAFNALLKTLEEPPEHVVFILATTDPQKIPPTVLSRVQRFDFRRIAVTEMVDKMKVHMNDEHIRVDEDALTYIAGISDGAMRDALSILDQCIAFYYGQDVTLDKVLDIVGAVDNQTLFELTEALARFDSAACMSVIDAVVNKGRDVNQFVQDLISHFRNLLMALNINETSAALHFSKETISKLKIQAKTLAQPTLLAYVHAFSQLQSEIKYAPNPRVLLEVACIKLCNPAAQTDGHSAQALERRIQKLEADIARGVLPAAPPHEAQAFQQAEKAKKQVKPSIQKAVPDDIKHVIANWDQLTKRFKMPLKRYLEAATPCYLEGETLVIVNEDSTLPEILKNWETTIKEQMTEAFKKDFSLSFLSKAEYDARHVKIYGTADVQTDVNKAYTDALGDDIIFEEN